MVVLPSAHAQVGATPEETWNNVVKQIGSSNAKKAFSAECEHVEWNMLYDEIKADNNKFLVKEKIASGDALKQYVKDAGFSVVDGSKVLSTLSEKPFLMEVFKRTMVASGQEDMANLAGAAGQYAEASKNNPNAGLPFSRIVADLEKPSNYLKFSVLAKETFVPNKEVWMQVSVTDLRTNSSQIMYVPFVKSTGKWYLKSYLPEGLWKNFNTRVDSVDMQRLIKLSRVLQKFG